MPQFSTNAGDKAGMQNIAIVITDGPVKGVPKIYVRGVRCAVFPSTLGQHHDAHVQCRVVVL